MSIRTRISNLQSRLVSNTILMESGRMYIAEGVGMCFAFLVVVTRSRLLTVYDVGLIDYIIAMVSLTSAFFNFGLDNTAARVILKQQNPENREKINGTALLLSFILAECYGLLLILINLSVPLWGREEIQPLVYLILPFAGYNIVLSTYKQTCYASGRISEASLQLYISYMIYWLILLGAHFLGFMGLKMALVASYAINMFTILLPILYWHHLTLHIARSALRELWAEHMERGWKIYLSRVFFSSTFNLDTLILGFFHPLDTVAHYSITKYLSMPVSMIGNSVSQSTYRQYGYVKKINTRFVLRVTAVTVTAAILMFGVGIIVVVILGREYMPMLKILPISILYSIIGSVNALYNSFMNAKGMAEELKRLAIMGACANLLFNYMLIVPFGAIGGVVASLIVVTIVLVSRIYYCRKYEIASRSD